MKVSDLMSTAVVAVAPETPLKEVAALLVEHRISGVPVCDGDGRVVGVVSEQDILYKELGAAERGGGPLAWFAGWPAAAAAKANARTAGDTMTSPALTILPTRPVSAAAETMVERHVNRLPVVDRDGRLVGIVTRSDLVRGFARGDADIQREIQRDLLEGSMWIPAGDVSVTVDQGDVSMGGTVDRRSEAEIAARLAERVPGVVSVRSRLRWRDDDLARRRRIPARAR